MNAYVKLTFATPQETNVTHTSYDTVISHNIYYCGTARFALVENDYFLSGKQALRDPSPAIRTGSTDVYEIAPSAPAPECGGLQPACRAIGVVSAPMAQLPGRYFTPDSLAALDAADKDRPVQIYLMGTYDVTQDAGRVARSAVRQPRPAQKVYSDYLTAHPELMHTDRTAAAIAAQAFNNTGLAGSRFFNARTRST